MKKDEIILVGGGGHCKSVIDVIEQENKFSIVGIVDIKEKIGESILGYKIIGCDNDLPELSKKYKNFIVTVGQIKSPKLRIKLFKDLENLNVNMPAIISPLAYISKHSTIGKGTVVMHNVLVNCGVKIGSNCIINTKALIEHEAEIGNNCHISTNAVINGQCKVKNNCFIGSNATLTNNITIAENTILSAGSFLHKNSVENGLYIGALAVKR